MHRKIPTLLLAALANVLLPAAPAAAGDAVPPPAHEQVVDLTFPTDARAAYSDTYDAPRGADRHHRATDLLGEKLWKVYAAVGGTVTWIPGAAGEPMPSYGYMITIAGDDGREYHYVHLNNDSPGTDDGAGGAEWAYAPGLKKGSAVTRGQFIGYLGDSGNAESGPAHLHFEIEDPSVTDPWGTHYLNPYFSLLDAEQRGDYGAGAGGGDASAPRAASPAARATGLACPEGQVPEDGFADLLDGVAHESTVDCTVWWEVARGRSATVYAPGAHVTRGQMATFLVRLMQAADHPLWSDPGDHFADDDGHPHEWAINQLAREQLVGGVGEGTFAPDAPVSRAQMATFLVNVVEHVTGEALGAGGDHFADDDGSAHEPSIDKVANAGLATGPADATYDPSAFVRRDQMGSFLARTLDLHVEAGHGSPPAA